MHLALLLDSIDRTGLKRVIHHKIVRFLLGLIALLAIAAMVGLLTVQIWGPALGSWLWVSPVVHQADAIVVLSGNAERTEQGIELYKEGWSPQFWHTGDVPLPGRTISYAQISRQRAIAQGVPAQAIHLLPSATTWEDGKTVAVFTQQHTVDSVLIVTSWYHSRRAICVVHHHLAGTGIDIYYDNPPFMLQESPDTWWQYKDSRRIVVSELIKIGFYWGWYGLSPWSC